MTKIKVYLSDTHDPWFNLATEDYLFKDMDPSFQVLFLWRNSETVVIGRFQNPWSECNLKKMEEDNVKLARRQSGGGAVFHDLGNTNFTFLSGKNNYNKERNNKIIINSLKKFNIDALASGRNDLVVRDKKISGSAFKESIDRAFHHGTLLINTNLEKLQNYLTPNPKKLVSKGISSVRARVANLVEFNAQISHEKLSEIMIKEFFNEYQMECEIELLNEKKLKTIPSLSNYYESLKDWKWRFGETPQFSQTFSEKFDWGFIEVNLDSKNGKIENISVYSDSLHPEMIEYLNLHLKGILLTKEGLELSFLKSRESLPMIESYLKEFYNWFLGQIK